MKRLISTLGVIIFIVSFSLAQSDVKIIVLPQHEENFNKTISWLKKDESFKNRVNFIRSIEETFKYAKVGDYESYVHWLSVFKSELSKLNDVEKSKLRDFILRSLTPVKREVSPMEVPGCRVDCLFTSCEITCPGGTKPKCRCEWFFADCGCEPYQ